MSGVLHYATFGAADIAKGFAVRRELCAPEGKYET
jgi:hypothetical protein